MQLYHVKTVYKTAIMADSPAKAYAKVWQMVKVEPGIIFSGVELAEEKKKRSLLKRLIFG